MIKEEFTVGVIISTYNNPAWLEKTLCGYVVQNRQADEIIVADDGSTEQTAEVVASFEHLLPIKHVWQEDIGFRKNDILNKALLAATSDYLIFTDQDCVPRRDFVESHCANAKENYFLSGGMYYLTKEQSDSLSKDEIASNTIFDIKFIRKNGAKLSWRLLKLQKNHTFAKFLNFITPTNASWNGCNASTWRKYALEIKGFDVRLRYGGEDREFGERLFNKGVKSKQLRYSLAIVHLDHSRPYRNREDIEKNNQMRKVTRTKKIIETEFGI
ncbi:MAG: glycosyltransferase [Rikenellaceae bacterium]